MDHNLIKFDLLNKLQLIAMILAYRLSLTKVVRRLGPYNERDVLGECEINRIVVKNELGTEVEFIVKNYNDKDIVVFEQHFVRGIKNAGHLEDYDDDEYPALHPQSGFPGTILS